MNVRVPQIKHGGGPKIFLDRMRKPMRKRGIILNESGQFDIKLAFISGYKKYGRPIVLRLDGCYYTNNYLQQNKMIKKSIEHADHVIYQSQFSMKMCNKLLKPNKKPPHSIIHNGISMVKLEHIKPKEDIPEGSFVICSTGEVKRVEASIKGFLEAGTGRRLYVIGDNKGIRSYRKNHNIKLLGNLNINNVLSVMKACQYQIHLAYIDSCPNSVVEGLACGLNVLHTNLGGTRELVKDDGIMLTIDEWDFSIQKGTPKNINPSVVADGIHRLMKIKQRANRKDLDIGEVADKYANVLHGVL